MPKMLHRISKIVLEYFAIVFMIELIFNPKSLVDLYYECFIHGTLTCKDDDLGRKFTQIMFTTVGKTLVTWHGIVELGMQVYQNGFEFFLGLLRMMLYR